MTTKHTPGAQSKKYRAPQPPTKKEQQNIESLAACQLTKQPKKSKMSKVKQVTSTINSKIIEIVKHCTDVDRYSKFIKKFSPESKPQSKGSIAKPLTRSGCMKQKSPIASPRMKSTSELHHNSLSFEAEKMSVKDKVQFYNKFMENNKIQTRDNKTTELIPPIPPPRKKRQARLEIHIPDSKVKQSLTEENQSDLKSLLETQGNEELSKPVKPLRKKKLQRNPSLKRNFAIKETNAVNSTDSEGDYTPVIRPTAVTNPEEPSIIEFDRSLMRVMNSPRKIKSAYILTISDCDTSLYKNINSGHSFLSKFDIKEDKCSKIKTEDADCSTDQGFETDTHNTEKNYPSSLDPTYKIRKNTFDFSTPIKYKLHQSFSCTNSAKQQLFSPITQPIKNHQKSAFNIGNTGSHPNSLSKQVIQEDQSLDNPKESSSRSFSTTEQIFFANAPTLDMSSNLTNAAESSKFWIKCANFSIAFNINYTESERLHLLYEIFSQTSCSTRDLHFGIDNHRFSVHHTNDPDNNLTRIPAATKGYTNYWFSTGYLDIPFSGKYLSSEKIQCLFQLLKLSIEEFGILRFGVDEVEFSNVPEFWNQPPKFSIDSNYSILVGLQSGNSNGLEGRPKTAWPYSKPSISKNLTQSQCEGEDVEEFESGRLLFPPLDFSILDNEELSMPRNSEAAMNLESYSFEFGSESLTQLFSNVYNPVLDD